MQCLSRGRGIVLWNLSVLVKIRFKGIEWSKKYWEQPWKNTVCSIFPAIRREKKLVAQDTDPRTAHLLRSYCVCAKLFVYQNHWLLQCSPHTIKHLFCTPCHPELCYSQLAIKIHSRQSFPAADCRGIWTPPVTQYVLPGLWHGTWLALQSVSIA